MESRVDQTALKFNQASIISLLLVAFIIDQSWLVAFVGLVMLVGTVWPAVSLFQQTYRRALQPTGLLRANIIPDNLNAHLFAQGIGALFLAASFIALLSGSALFGWALAWIVIVLAAINLFAGFCLGCFIYYQLGRAGLTVSLPTWR